MLSICRGSPLLLLLSRVQVPEKSVAALTDQMPASSASAAVKPIKVLFIICNLLGIRRVPFLLTTIHQFSDKTVEWFRRSTTQPRYTQLKLGVNRILANATSRCSAASSPLGRLQMIARLPCNPKAPGTVTAGAQRG